VSYPVVKMHTNAMHWCFTQLYKTHFGWHQQTTQSHPVINVLYKKLDAECDWQARVISRLLILLGDDQRAVTKLFFVQHLGKSSRWNYAYLRDIRMSYLSDKYSQLQGACALDQKLWIQ